MENVTFEQIPTLIGQLFAKIERIEQYTCNIAPHLEKPLSKYVDINGAAEITSKTPNALRVQISLGNLKSIKKGSRHYFDREYLEHWIVGDVDSKRS
jgi:hypothetical protein